MIMVNEALQTALKALQGQISIAENALKLYRSKLDALEKAGKKDSAEYRKTTDRANSLQALIDHYRSIYDERKALLNIPTIEKRRRTKL
jgi:chromosome segregation ATPase